MIELSCDLGEASDDSGRAVETELWTLIDAANVACGGHAGDEDSMRDAARISAARGIILGAHPSYPDRENFGRKSMSLDPRELRRTLIHQLSVFAKIAAAEDVSIQRIKAHGALYNDAHRDRALAQALIDAARDVDESISIVHEKPGSMKIGHYLPGTRIPIGSDDDLFKAPRGGNPLLNLAWHIPDEIRNYLRQNGYDAPVIDILNQQDFQPDA